MEAAGDDLLAGARLALDQDRGVGRSDAGDLVAQALQGRALAQQRWQVARPLEGAGEAALGDRAAHGEQQVGAVGRLGQVGGGAGLEALARGELVAVASEDDDRDVEAALAQVVHQPEAVHAGHLDVEHRGVGRLGVEEVEGLERVAGLLDRVAGGGEGAHQRLAHRRVVVDDQDSAVVHRSILPEMSDGRAPFRLGGGLHAGC